MAPSESNGRQLQAVWRRLQKEQIARTEAETKLKAVQVELDAERKGRGQFGQASTLLEKNTRQIESERKARASAEYEALGLREELERQNEDLMRAESRIMKLEESAGPGSASSRPSEAATLSRKCQVTTPSFATLILN